MLKPTEVIDPAEFPPSPELERWIKQLLATEGLGAGPKLFGIMLAMCFADRRTGEFNTTSAVLAAQSEASERTVDRAMTRLKDCGFVKFGGSPKAGTTFRLTFPVGTEFRRATSKDKEQSKLKPNDAHRQPTREQKRQIIDLLTAVYDTGGMRYRGGESDVTVAEAIGGGCMFGWVAAIRDDLFGPDGKNEELSELVAAFDEWAAAAQLAMNFASTLLNDATKANTDLKKAMEDHARLKNRLEALVKAAGPRAKHLA